MNQIMQWLSTPVNHVNNLGMLLIVTLMAISIALHLWYSAKTSAELTKTKIRASKAVQTNDELTQSVANLLKNNRNFAVVLAAQCQAIYDIRKNATKSNALALIYELDSAVKIQQERLAELNAKGADASQ